MRTINEPALVIEDLSVLGQISMVAGLSVLHSFDLETAALPTTILSTQTEEFGQPRRLDTQKWLNETLDHWYLIPDLDFSGALVGYIGQIKLFKLIERVIDNKLGIRPVLIDPVMADNGALYPGLGDDYVRAMRELCKKATIITPNWTELCLLAGEKNLTANRDNAELMFEQLQKQGIDGTIVITGYQPTGSQKLGCLFNSYEEGIEFVATARVNGHFYGTGDIFAAALLGFILKDFPFSVAVKKAVNAVYLSVTDTANQEPYSNRKYGMQLGKMMQYISKQCHI